jgi:2-methylcitrate dehydratase PrpD
MILVGTDESVNEIMGRLEVFQEYVVGLLGQEPYNGERSILGLPGRATMTRPFLTATLAEFCVNLDPAALGPPEVAHTGRLMLDFLGVAARGLDSPSTQALSRSLESLGSLGNDRPALAFDPTTPPLSAALLLGNAAHSLELDDLHNASSLHPGVVVFPAALAAARLTGSTPLDFVAAVVVGYEVATRVGEAVNPETLYNRGLHPTATCGGFGAAAAAGRLLGLSPEGLARAWGVCGSQAAGSMAFLSEGAWTKHLHAGLAAQAGLNAAMLAREGFRAPTAIFEDPLGFLHAYAVESRPDRLVGGLGKRWAVTETSLKPHACCRYMQPAIDGLIALAEENDLAPDQVASVTIHCIPAGFLIIAEPTEKKADPQRPTEAQFSMPYGAAVAIARRRAGLDDFADDALRDPTIRELLPKVHCIKDEELGRTWPERWSAVVAVETQNGERHTRRIDDPKGDPANPLTDAEIVEKFTGLASSFYPASHLERIIDAALSVGTLETLDTLWALLPAGS